MGGKNSKETEKKKKNRAKQKWRMMIVRLKILKKKKEN